MTMVETANETILKKTLHRYIAGFHTSLPRRSLDKLPFPEIMWRNTFLLLSVQAVLLLFAYYSCYDFVYPASKTASIINSSSGWFVMGRWAFAAVSLVPNSMVGLKIFLLLPRKIPKRMTGTFKWSALILWLVFCVWVCTWGLWLSWPIGELWHKSVWEHGCQGWDIEAVLDGISNPDFMNSSAPLVGIASVSRATGNYSMAMVRLNSSDGEYYQLSLKDVVGYSPPFSNVTYNPANTTYTINGTTTKFSITPNLSFPSNNLETLDPTIPFLWRPPMQNLVHCVFNDATGRPNLANRSLDLSSSQKGHPQTDKTCSRFLETVTIKPHNCTQLKVCGMLDHAENFQIPLGFIMIQHFFFSMCCQGGCPGQAAASDIRWSDATAGEAPLITIMDPSKHENADGNLCPDLAKRRSILSCPAETLGLGLCTCPDLTPDPDIGGVGVLTPSFYQIYLIR
jgi:hypothetical protein